jgi:hypothetical protein
VRKVRAEGRLEDRSVTIELSLAISAEVAKALPKDIQDEHRFIKSAGSGVPSVKFDRTIDSQNIKFWRLPTDQGKEDFGVENVDLTSLVLEYEDANYVFLYFKIQHAMTKSAWDWLWYASQREVFAEFEEYQGKLKTVPD